MAEYGFLAAPGISDAHKSMLLEAALKREEEVRGAPEARRQFIHNTPLVLALVGLITIAGNALVSYFLNNQTAYTTASQTEREFSYGVIQTELAKTDDEIERANLLLFLVKVGVLDGLDRDELEAIAERSGATALTLPASIGQNALPNYAEPIPNEVTGQTREGNLALQAAVAELNSNIEETASQRVTEYWTALPQWTGPTDGSVAWQATFVSWIIKQTTNPDGLAGSAAYVELWKQVRAAGIVLEPGEDPLPGDLVFYAEEHERFKQGEFVTGAGGIVYQVTPTDVTYIGGNIRNALRTATRPKNDPRLIGYARLGKM